METLTLTLRHLSGYLPYGLKIHTIDDDGKTVIQGIKNISFTRIIGQYAIETTDGWDVCYGDFKPLLIPLSELTEDQWVEVFKAGLPEFKLEPSDAFYIEAKIADYRVGEQFAIITYRAWTTNVSVTYDVKNQSFRISGDNKFSQLAAFNKLYELHADLENLIENGLALNKLTNGK